MYACGLRISEAATLEVTAVDGINGLVRVVGKGNKERRVPLPQPVLDELRRLWKMHRNPRWLCPNRSRNGPISRDALWCTGDDLYSVDELHTCDQLWQLVVTIKAAPTFLRGLNELEHHGERGLALRPSTPGSRPHWRPFMTPSNG